MALLYLIIGISLVLLEAEGGQHQQRFQFDNPQRIQLQIYFEQQGQQQPQPQARQFQTQLQPQQSNSQFQRAQVPQPQQQQRQPQFQFPQQQPQFQQQQPQFQQTQQQQQQQCGVPPNRVSRYHAPPTVVPPPTVDTALQREFLLLFHREGNPTHQHMNPHDNLTPPPPSTGGGGGGAMTNVSCTIPIDPAIIRRINELCNRDSLFYSFSPRHQMAIQLIQQVFMSCPTPRDLLNLAKVELSRHEINPRVWYHALGATFLMRPDLNGYSLAGPIDATPDLYVPWSLIRQAISRSVNRSRLSMEMEECTTSIGANVRSVRYTEPAMQAQFQQTQQQFQQTQQQFQQTQQQLQPTGQQFQQTQQQFQQTQQQFQPTQQFQQTQQQYLPPQQQQFQPTQQQQFQQQSQPDPRTSNYNTFSDPYFSNVQFEFLRRKRQSPQYQRGQQFQGREPECLFFNGTNGATGPENLLWYFRENVQVNEHHWYWHQYYPQSSMRHGDRRGENFYFMHHNLVARYQAERLSNGLPLETELDLRLGASIGTGYTADLNDRQSGRFWTPRADNIPLSDVLHQNNPDFNISITMAEITRLRDTIVNHVSQGFLIANRSVMAGQPPMEFQVDIRNEEGFSHFGNTLEASEELSLHANLYHSFGLHNLGHVAIALSTDPDFRCRLPTGIMADASVTMRDPAFYKIHTLVDTIFDQSKFTLPAYQPTSGDWPLQWPGVSIASVDIVVPDQRQRHPNLIQTFWQVTSFPLEEGIDGSIHDGDVDTLICHQHLNHEPFQFRLTVDVDSCAQSRSNRGTVRIFMAPRFDLNGRRFTMQETRMLMFQLDAFQVDLRPGRNIITRNSFDSASTRPWSRTLRDMLMDPGNSGRSEDCGCGWPHHLYIPKGTPEGMQFDLFAMITNWDDDRVEDRPEDLRIPIPCNSPYLFCGVPYRRYPDRRPMGYPFDRQVPSVRDSRGGVRPAAALEEFVTLAPNMRSNVVTVRHLNVFAQ